MIAEVGREIRFKERPAGMPTESCFELAEVPVPRPKDGQILVRNIWMSVDPYMRGRMRPGKSYVAPFQIGSPLEGGCVGQVVASQNDEFSVGDYVTSMYGWREYWISDGFGVSKVDPKAAPIQTYLGTLGMPGMTAYVGLLKIGDIKPGETVFVSAAAGAVGSVACQIARIEGCRVVGSTGSDEKVAWLLDEAGVDHAFNYRKADSVLAALQKGAPDGLDVCFENVGGEHLNAALQHMRDFGRIVMCGMISQYNVESSPPGPGKLFLIIPKRIRMQGFIARDHYDIQDRFRTDMARWIREGKVKWRETVVEGLENAPKAFLGLFRGENIGKMLVKIGPDPAV
jgi:NADPH-dependent curcumin reductase CurA